MPKVKKNKHLQIGRTIMIVLLAIVLIANINIIIQTKINPKVVPNMFGYKPFIVLSGSMETKINIGDLVVVKNVNPKDLKVDDIIAFREQDNYVTTHRIIEIVKNEKNESCFRTKGDNNNVADDNVVCPEMVEGKYQFKIAKIGSVILFIQKPLGFIVMIMSIIILCMAVYFFKNRNQTLNEEELKEFEEFKKSKEKKNL